MGYDFDENGVYIGWSPLFDYSSIETIHESERLPTPSGINYVGYSNEGLDITPELQALQLNNDLKSKVDLIVRVGSSEKLSYNPELIDEGFAAKALALINSHTTYRLKPYNEAKAYKNATSSRISQVIQNLKNMLAAYSPIDMGDPGDAAKGSALGKVAETLIMDTPSATWNMQTQNLAGKQVIGIAAVGEKVFFANCYYFNEGVRSNDKDWEENMFFYRKFRFLDDNKSAISVRNLIANVNFDNLPGKEAYFKNLIEKTIEEDLTNKDVAKIVKQDLDLTEDESLVISSLLSAATDNAKELILSKINAGPDLASVYIHLITMGFPFKNIAGFMTSPAVQLVNDLSKSNIYDDYNESNKIPNVVNTILNGPNVSKYAPRKIYAAVFNKAWGTSYKTAKEFNDALSKRFNDGISLEYTNSPNVNRFVQEFNYLLKKRASIDLEYIKEFKYIYSLAQETSLLGRFYGINQGLKTDAVGKLGFYSTLESGITTRENEYNIKNTGEFVKSIIEDKPQYAGREDFVRQTIETANALKISKGGFSIREFFKNEDYKKATIAYYNLIKGTWNIYDMITKIPHFKALFEVADVVDTYDRYMSNRFNLTNKLKYALTEGSRFKNLKSDQLRGISEYVDDLLIIKWLEGSDFSFNLHEGDSYFKNGVKKVAASDINMKLDTDDGRASFKLWFEQTVIPSLQKGEADTKSRKLGLNKFLQSLNINERVDNYNKYTTTYYKLPLDMSNIKTDSEQRQFNTYLTEFAALQKFTYQGTSVTDLFTYYNLIVNKNKYGSDRLTSIFEGFLRDEYNESVMRDYFKFVGDSDYYLQAIDTIFELDDVRRKIAPIVSENNQWSATDTYIRQYDQETGKYILKKRQDNEYVSVYPIDNASETELNDYYSHYLLTAPEYNTKLTELTLSEDLDKDMLYNSLKKLLARNSINISINC